MSSQRCHGLYSLIEVLDRILDKGIVIGDITTRISIPTEVSWEKWLDHLTWPEPPTPPACAAGMPVPHSPSLTDLRAFAPFPVWPDVG